MAHGSVEDVGRWWCAEQPLAEAAASKRGSQKRRGADGGAWQ